MAATSSLRQLRLSGNSLINVNPKKVIVQSDKKLSIHRFARGSTPRDLLTRMQLRKGRRDLGLRTRDNRQLMEEEIGAQMDLDFYLLVNANRFKTRLTVSLNGRGFGCWFEPERVSFEDVMVDVAKQAEVPARQLFSKELFCCGCGRKVCQEEKEEDTQRIPSDCCKVKSLELTDRRLKGHF